MAQDFGEPIPIQEDDKKKRTWIIIAIVAVIILCCCSVIAIWGGKWLWDNGDQLLQDWGLAAQFALSYL